MKQVYMSELIAEAIRKISDESDDLVRKRLAEKFISWMLICMKKRRKANKRARTIHLKLKSPSTEPSEN